MNTREMTPPEELPLARQDQDTARTAGWLLIVGILFIGAVLRAPLTSVGPLIGTIKGELGISNTLAGTLTTLPLLMFAVISPFAPKWARKYGIEAVLLAAAAILTVGILLRSALGAGTLFLGTALLGVAIALCNVLLPSLIKRDFPARIGLMTGVYSVSMNLSGAAASGISVPAASGLGWKGALGAWAALSLLALLFWLPLVNGSRKARQGAARVSAVSANSSGGKSVSVWKSPLAWKVTLFMGLQSTFFYAFVAWLPAVLNTRGLSAEYAGWMLSLMQLALLPITFVVPILAARMANQRFLVTLTCVLFLAGILGLLLGSTALVPLWIILAGIGGGCAFSLAMMFFSLRTRSAQQSAELSGMAQSFGYLLAAAGPILFGFLHDTTGGWTTPLLLLAAIAVLLFVVGQGAAANGFVGEERGAE
ncbi:MULTISPECIES: MFS transporter [unclassified Paenibacillus]|uniref:CynX/NimT family MFS transporter n=1 Tax=unclassified Paenibacillus TaxID=185978 RepID=UPI00020D6EA8|nr:MULTISPECIES: MFS transporter [unclassified Paenibacillus]EGL18881.1 transporter, major facilitator family protein [Paenibacillus sp. HGF7]EPD92673.1 cyanate transporter [Paenibacillus sp. HGH0039]